MSMVEEQSRIIAMIDRGATFEVIEEDVIEGAPLDDDSKAALWLFAWASIPSDSTTDRSSRRP